MGFFEKVRQALSVPALAAGSLEVPYASAWADPNHLITVGTPDLLPESTTRDVAMNVAALARAPNYCQQHSQMPPGSAR